ncbi:hypothetical protein TgHK011_008052 [Trichoderma gracile]|nr:hypothetical protein TgHK011_008052 [Trichoderma gracile]
MDRVLGAFTQPRRPKDQYSISSSYISGSQSCLRERAKPIIADANAASNGDARTGQNAKDQALRRYLGLSIGCRCLSGLLMKKRPEHRAWAISRVVVVEDRPMASGRPSTLRRNLLRPPSTQPSIVLQLASGDVQRHHGSWLSRHVLQQSHRLQSILNDVQLSIVTAPIRPCPSAI